MDFLVYLFVFLCIFIIAWLTIIPLYKKHNKVTKGIINYDADMKVFVYKVNLSKEDIINLLTTRNITDELSCSFDYEESVITFSEYGSDKKYYFYIQEYSNFSVLRLEQTALISTQSTIPLKLNPFIVSKLKAEIIPYAQYGVSK